MELKKISDLSSVTPSKELLLLVEDTNKYGRKIKVEDLYKAVTDLDMNGYDILNIKGVDFRINASATNYIRWENGLQICWGASTFEDGSDFVTATYPIAFSSTKPVVLSTGRSSLHYNVNIHSEQLEYCTIVRRDGTGALVSSGVGGIYWVAIGRWK